MYEGFSVHVCGKFFIHASGFVISFIFSGKGFRNELAIEVKKLGIKISTKILSDGSSSFELSHIDNKLIDAFSTRRQEIEALCKLYGVTTKEGRDNIVINSRKAKQKIKEETLHKAWHNLVSDVQKELNIEKSTEDKLNKKEEELEKIKTEGKIQTKNLTILNKIGKFFTKDDSAKEIERNIELKSANNLEQNVAESSELGLKDLVFLCVEDVSTNKSVFSKEELFKKVLKYSIGHYNIEQIQKEMGDLEKEGILIKNEGVTLTV